MSAPRKKDGLFATVNHMCRAIPPRPSAVFGISVYRRGAGVRPIKANESSGVCEGEDIADMAFAVNADTAVPGK